MSLNIPWCLAASLQYSWRTGTTGNPVLFLFMALPEHCLDLCIWTHLPATVAHPALPQPPGTWAGVVQALYQNVSPCSNDIVAPSEYYSNWLMGNSHIVPKGTRSKQSHLRGRQEFLTEPSFSACGCWFLFSNLIIQPWMWLQQSTVIIRIEEIFCSRAFNSNSHEGKTVQPKCGNKFDVKHQLMIYSKLFFLVSFRTYVYLQLKRDVYINSVFPCQTMSTFCPVLGQLEWPKSFIFAKWHNNKAFFLVLSSKSHVYIHFFSIW